MSAISCIRNKQSNGVVQERAYTPEEEMAITLVHTLPDSSTITIGQIKELAPVLVKIFEQRTAGLVSRANGWDRLVKYIKETFPETYEKASRECCNNNCQSMPTILITTIEKLTREIDQERED